MRFKRLKTSSCVIMTVAFCTALCTASENFKIKGDKFGNWWTLGDTINFKPENKLPETVKTVNGVICDSDDKELARHAVNATEFNTVGWTWRPTVPGFYTVKFNAIDSEGNSFSLGVSNEASVVRNTTDKKPSVIKKTFVAESYGIGVLPTPTRKPSDMPPQFGVSLGWAMDGSEWHNKQMLAQARLAALMGAHSVRLQCVGLWDLTEPALGKYDWRMLDWWFDSLKKEGFKDFAVTLQGTPKWAVAKPDSGNTLIPHYLAQPPKDLIFWSDYISAIQSRYPFVEKWELWNEPGSFPGQSCFWLGTQEEFCSLLKTGYETIKRNQPDAKCFLGCALPGLHEYIIRNGFNKYYDAVSLHGKWGALQGSKIDATIGGKPKPWVNLEWHAILTSADNYPYPSEKELAHNMLISFMNQISLGADAVYVYGPLGFSYNKDFLDFHRQNGNAWVHEFGFFSYSPSIQPRLPAVVWRNFSDLFSGNVKYLNSFAFGTQCAVLMDSSVGKVLLFWQNGNAPCRLDPQLAKALNSTSILLSWEGRKQDASSFELKPAEIYFVRQPDMNIVENWSAHQENVLRKYSSNAKTIELDNSVNGRYRQGRLFDNDLKPVNGDSISWNQVPRYVSLNGKGAPQGFFAKYAIAIDPAGIDLLVVVKDMQHVVPAAAKMKLWEGDSVQLAIDTKNTGLADDRLELIASLMPDGALLWKQMMPPFDGFLPASCSSTGSLVKFAQQSIVHNNDETVYSIRLPAGELYPFEYSPGRTVRFSLLVNCNDGNGRIGWLEWASGIGKMQDPAQYGNLTVDIGEKNILEQKDLSSTWGNVVLEFGDGSVKVPATDANNTSAVCCKPFNLVPGATYYISFQAKGNVPLEGMLNSIPRKNEKSKRLNMFKEAVLLSDKWQNFEATLIIPPGFEHSTAALFCFKRTGFFEIKNFKMIAK